MLSLHIPASELWDERECVFVQIPETVLNLEHSLLSISKWEAKIKKPFLGFEEKTLDETIEYIRCMTLNKIVDPNVYYGINDGHLMLVNGYISDPMSATTIKKSQTASNNGELLTSEVLYYYMIAFNIPFECQKWHINRLLKLLDVCEVKSRPGKKMSQQDLYKKYSEVNAARKAKYGIEG